MTETTQTPTPKASPMAASETSPTATQTGAQTLCRLAKAGLFLPGDMQRRLILRDIDLEIHKGEHMVLIGKNGAGKTTLLRLLHGEAWTTQGSIAWYDGREFSSSRITGLAVTSLISPAMQENFQRHAWDITGRELMLTGFDGTDLLYSEPLPQRVSRVEEMAEALGATPLLSRSILELSQGQLRLLLLGRAMVRKPSLLLLDECTDGLDARHRELFATALEKLADESTIVLTTHRESMLPSWISRKIYIDDGRLYATPHGLEDEMEGLSVTLAREEREVSLEPLISVENADVYVCGKKVLHTINWQLHAGENWLLQGANGSGKSTFLRMLAGDEQVAWPGKITFTLPQEDNIPFAILRRRVRLVSDYAQALYEYDVNCLELVLSGLENTVGIYREFSGEEKEYARAQLARVGLAGREQASIRAISTGQLRRAFLARALMGCPLVLLLDEACTGLDVRGRLEYLDVLDKLVDEGLSYVFVSHYQEDIPTSVNRSAIMRDGTMEITS